MGCDIAQVQQAVGADTRSCHVPCCSRFAGQGARQAAASRRTRAQLNVRPLYCKPAWLWIFAVLLEMALPVGDGNVAHRADKVPSRSSSKGAGFSALSQTSYGKPVERLTPTSLAWVFELTAWPSKPGRSVSQQSRMRLGSYEQG